MPTIPGTPTERLTPQAALEKVSSLIQEIPDEPAETTAPDAPPAPPEATPPETSDQEPPEQAPTDRYPVVVDGVSEEVDLEELKSGYRFNKHNTQTAQTLAAERREFDAERDAVRAERQEYAGRIGALVKVLEQLQGEPDWTVLRQQLEPAEFLKHKADWEASKAHTERLKAEQTRLAEKAAQDAQADLHRTLRAEQEKLHAAYPELADETKRTPEFTKLLTAAKQYGYSEAEFKGVTDHRPLLLLRDAMRYRELHREPTPRAKQAAIKTAKPGTPERPRPNQQFKEKFERAAKSGRQRDAMDVIADLLPD